MNTPGETADVFSHPCTLDSKILLQYGGRGFESVNGERCHGNKTVRLGATYRSFFRNVAIFFVTNGMVKAQTISTMEDSWWEVFERSRLVPPPSQTAHLAVDSNFTQSHGVQLNLSRLTAPHLPKVTALS